MSRCLSYIYENRMLAERKSTPNCLAKLGYLKNLTPIQKGSDKARYRIKNKPHKFTDSTHSGKTQHIQKITLQSPYTPKALTFISET